MKFNAITVFCSASGSTSSIYAGYMRQVGELLSDNNVTMVFGGGDEGMMGKVLEGVVNRNGPVKGVITDKLFAVECHHPEVFKPGELIKVETMAERKIKMFELGDAILVGPGGWGTIDEISDYAVSVQIGDIARKPMVFLNFNDFWRPMKDMILTMLTEGTLNQDKVDFIDFANTIEDIFPALERIQSRLDARAAGEPVTAAFCACASAHQK